MESACVLAAGFSVLAAMLLFHRMLIARGYTDQITEYATLAVFLGSPVWFYSRSFFTEPFILLAIVAAYWAVQTQRSPIWAGACIALAMLMKPQSALFVIALALPLAFARKWRDLGKLAVFPTTAFAILLGLNAHMYGSPWRGPYSFEFGNPLEALVGLSVSREHGLLWYAPALLLGIFGWCLLDVYFGSSCHDRPNSV